MKYSHRLAPTGPLERLADARDAIRAESPTLAERAIITADPAALRDESPVAEVAPALVVYPQSVADVQLLVRIARDLTLPMVPRGGRTGLVGACIPVQPSMVIDTSEMKTIEVVDIPGRYLRIGPGVRLGEIETLLGAHGMMYPPDPASYRRATIGGTVATNAGGLRCVKYGVTGRWVRTLDIVLADGSLISLGHPVVKDVTGYDLKRLFVGAEGTLGIIVSVGVSFCPRPASSRLLLAAFDGIAAAATGVTAIMNSLTPSMCELLDAGALRSRGTSVLAPLLGDIEGWGADPTLLMVQVDGPDSAAERTLLQEVLEPTARDIHDVLPGQIEAVMDMRRGGSAVRSGDLHLGTRIEAEESLVDPGTPQAVLPQDLSIPVNRLPSVVSRIREVAKRFELESRIAAHAGDGNLHLLFASDSLPSENSGVRLHRAMDEIIDFVLESNGTISGEHGIGSIKRDWAARDLGEPLLRLHHRTKLAFDPESLMNPGKAF